MKTRWLNFITVLTNRIYRRKQSIVAQSGLRVVWTIFGLILSEIFLALVSFPLYLTTRSNIIIAFLEKKGEYKKISTDFALRRVLTLTGVGIVFIIWTVKLFIIALTPQVYGPLELYSVSGLEPVDIEHQEVLLQDTGMQTARVVDTFSIPTITDIEKKGGDNYIISGSGQAGEALVLFLVDKETVMYTAPVDENGNWQVEHSQEDFRLTEGLHAMFAFHYNEKQGIRSNTSEKDFFRVRLSVFDRIVENIDNLTNWTVVIVIVFGVFFTFLTL